ncbi:MAG: hypothetical protein JXQ75_10535 [Phycisphaerae bacterium]|nr:hypothetical protein [Phycisphaerae bacterium]
MIRTCCPILCVLLMTWLTVVAVGQVSSSDRSSTPEMPVREQVAIPFAAPVTFARSGQEVDAYLVRDGWGLIGDNKVVLSAFGRTWAGPMNVAVTSANVWVRLSAPKVRVPTVFAIIGQGSRVVGELVVYPDRDVPWGDEKIALYDSGAPKWFGQWSKAVGLPITDVALADLPPGPTGTDGEPLPALVVVGRVTAEQGIEDPQKLASRKRVNVLVLEAARFGPVSGRVAIEPRQIGGSLVQMQEQRWPKPLEFSSCLRPWNGIANRWAWITGANGLPLVEEICHADTAQREKELQRTPPGPRVVVSYLPWAEQLGRSDSADATMLALLKAAARPRSELHWRMVEMVWPTEDKILVADRPVLQAALAAWAVIGDIPDRFDVIDLRGPQGPGADLAKQLKDVQRTVEHTLGIEDRTQLLILGDDKMLDEWAWLRLDRQKKTVGWANIAWLPSDALPPSTEDQIRLMLKLTELGVPLMPPSNEEKRQ